MADEQNPESGNDGRYGLMQQNLLLKKRNHELEMRLLRMASKDDELLPRVEDEPTPVEVPDPTPVLETEESRHLSPAFLDEDLDQVMERDHAPLVISLPSQPVPPGASRRVIKTKEDLTEAEKWHAVYDMLQSRRRCCEVENAFSREVTSEDCDKAIDLALEGWNTSLPARRMEKLPKTFPDSHRTSRIAYSTFAVHDAQNMISQPHRHRGADVYLYFSPLNIGGDANRFSFRDSKGNPVKNHFVCPRPDLDIDKVKETLIRQYDIEERRIIGRINEKLMVAKTQRRLVQFADRGAANRLEPSFDARLEKKHLDFIVARIYAV